MNDIIRGLHERKSVRVYQDKPVSLALKTAVIEAAMAAPSAGCQQMYSIIDVTDRERKAALAKSCDDQPFIATAPVALVFCADMQKWYDAFRLTGAKPRLPGAGDFVLAVQDTLIAAQNAVTAAESLGLGSCYIGDMMERCAYHRELLHLPPFVFPATLLVLGYPVAAQLAAQKKPQRCAAADIVHENYYHPYDREGLERLFACKGDDFDGFMQRFCARKYNAEFSLEMTHSVEEYLRDWTGE